jgi:predicted PilT family ATPase
MKREEKAILIIDKENIGESREQAYKEIKELEKSQEQFKILYHEKNKLEHEVTILEKELKQAREKNFKLKFELDKGKKVEKVEHLDNATNSHNHIIRIMRNMEIGKEYMKTELQRELCIGSTSFNECMAMIDKCKQFEYEVTKDGRYKRTK